MRTEYNAIWASLIGAVAFIIGVIIFTHTWHKNYELNQTISVTGSATQTFTSDIGNLEATIQAEASTSEKAYDKLQAEKPAVIQFFRQHGFDKADIEFGTPNSYERKQYDSYGHPTGKTLSWSYNQQVKVKSNDVEKVKRMSLQMNALVKKGITLNVQPPKFYYSNLDSIKVAIQSRAARNAKTRAQKISKATGQTLGIMRSARMGVLQITPINSNRVSSRGINDASTIQKEITGVVSAKFQIK